MEGLICKVQVRSLAGREVDLQSMGSLAAIQPMPRYSDVPALIAISCLAMENARLIRK